MQSPQWTLPDLIDADGMELSSFEEARAHALSMIQERAATIRQANIPIRDQTLTIRDEEGRVLDTIFFRDVVLQS